MSGFEGKATVCVMTPTHQAAAYAAGDQLGSLVTLANAMDATGDTGAVLSVTVIDKAKQKSAIDLLLFSASPTVASADNAPLDISDAEMAAKFLGKVSIAAADYSDLAASSVASVRGVGLMLKSANPSVVDGIPESNNIYAILECQGTPTYTSTTDLVIKIGVVQD